MIRTPELDFPAAHSFTSQHIVMRRSLIVFLFLLFPFLPSMAQQFGSVVAVNEQQVLIGDGGQATVPGLIYVFERGQNDDWVETARIDGSEYAEKGDGFGRVFSLDGQTLAVGVAKTARVHIYSWRSDSGWTQSATLDSADEQFGSAVAVRGDHLLVTTPPSDDSPGMVSTYKRNAAGVWESQGQLLGDETAEGEPSDQFGSALALYGTLAAVSAPSDQRGNGVVYSFEYDEASASWNSTGRVGMPFDESGSQAGSALWMDEHSLILGAPGFANRVGTVAIYSFEDENNRWSFDNRLSPFSSVRAERFGTSLAFTGDEIWVGAPGHGGRRGSGAVYRFSIDEESGDVTGSSLFPIPEVQDNSQIGASLAASSHIAVLGAPGYDFRAGAAFAASRSGSGWDFSQPLVNVAFGYDSVSGDTIECEEALAGDFPCKDVDMISLVSMEDLGADRGIRTNDLWGWEDPETGREYAIVGLVNQTSFVDITDASNPVYLGELDMPSTANMAIWRDMKVYKDHAYIVSDGAGEHGIQIFDLRQLRNVTSPVTFEETAHYPGIFSAHNIVINEETGFAYSVGSSAGGETCGGGLHMIDIREPANPVFAGCFSDGESGRRGTGYSHDAQCVIYRGPDADYAGHEICIGANETAISIADVTDKENPVGVSMASYPSVSYAHQGWFTDDHRYFYLNDELDEAGDLVEGTRTLIWDLEDLDEPVLAGEHIATTTETDHNLYVKGNLMYQSNTGAGLRILDITDPENPFETAFFDTSPVGGRGVSWSNYPYFKSGVIAVTGGHYGLFLLKKKEVDI